MNKMDRMETKEPIVDQIPPMTDGMGRFWKQPDRSTILIDETHALMSLKDFDLLQEYSTSRPSGVYTGKMWKMLFMNQWLLVWYGAPADPDSVWTHYRKILIC